MRTSSISNTTDRAIPLRLPVLLPLLLWSSLLLSPSSIPVSSITNANIS